MLSMILLNGYYLEPKFMDLLFTFIWQSNVVSKENILRHCWYLGVLIVVSLRYMDYDHD